MVIVKSYQGQEYRIHELVAEIDLSSTTEVSHFRKLGFPFDPGPSICFISLFQTRHEGLGDYAAPSTVSKALRSSIRFCLYVPCTSHPSRKGFVPSVLSESTEGIDCLSKVQLSLSNFCATLSEITVESV